MSPSETAGSLPAAFIRASRCKTSLQNEKPLGAEATWGASWGLTRPPSQYDGKISFVLKDPTLPGKTNTDLLYSSLTGFNTFRRRDLNQSKEEGAANTEPRNVIIMIKHVTTIRRRSACSDTAWNSAVTYQSESLQKQTAQRSQRRTVCNFAMPLKSRKSLKVEMSSYATGSSSTANVSFAHLAINASHHLLFMSSVSLIWSTSTEMNSLALIYVRFYLLNVEFVPRAAVIAI